MARSWWWRARATPTRWRLSQDWAAKTGALQIHAFDQPETLLGQGTVAREFAAQAPQATTWLVAVGGGGLIGGMAAWSAGRHKIVAVEPEAAPTLHMARAAGQSGRCAGRRHRRGFAGAASRSAA